MNQFVNRLPVSVLTGFLGSGKTTLLNRILHHPGMDETAVIVNEFGEIGIDHALVEKASDDVILMASGCLCCNMRGELLETLDELAYRREKGEIPPFKRILVETTGLADPAPILQGLIYDAGMMDLFQIGHVVTVVDAVHGIRTLQEHREAVKQVALADRLVISKSDLASAADIAAVTKELHRLNPGAPLLAVQHGEIDPAKLFGDGRFDLDDRISEVRDWIDAEVRLAAEEAHGHDHDHAHEHATGLDPNRHDDRVHAFCLTFDQPLDLPATLDWLETVSLDHGENILRVKGLLNVAGQEAPIVIHGVHFLYHPPVTLAAWPDQDRRSRIVFIVRDLDRAAVEKGMPGQA